MSITYCYIPLVILNCRIAPHPSTTLTVRRYTVGLIVSTACFSVGCLAARTRPEAGGTDTLAQLRNSYSIWHLTQPERASKLFMIKYNLVWFDMLIYSFPININKTWIYKNYKKDFLAADYRRGTRIRN